MKFRHFLSYGSGSTSQKVTDPTVPVPVPVPQRCSLKHCWGYGSRHFGKSDQDPHQCQKPMAVEADIASI